MLIEDGFSSFEFMKQKWIKYHVVFFLITWAFNFTFNFYLKIPDGKLFSYTSFFVLDNFFLVSYFYSIILSSQFVLNKIRYFIPFLIVLMLLSCALLSIIPYAFYCMEFAGMDYSHIYFIKMFEVSYMTFSGIGFLFLHKFEESALQKVHLTESLSDAELTFLRSQMSPHFLLNTLNTIYALALRKSPEIYAAISELNTIYSYVKKNEGKVSLKNEVEYLENFMKIQQRRFGNAVKLTFDLSIDREYEIEPLLLSSFVENAFKHGVSMKEESYITIKLKVENGKLDYTVENSDHASKYKDSTSGIGIQNLSRRLELLYFDRFSLQHARQGKSYLSTLSIQPL